MLKNNRKELESSLQGLVVKRFNHYLHCQASNVKRCINLLSEETQDKHHLLQRLKTSQNSLNAAIKADKSNSWISAGLDKIKLADELIDLACTINTTDKSQKLNSVLSVVKYELNASLYLEGFGDLGKLDKTSQEQQVIDILLYCSHTLNTSGRVYKGNVYLVMDCVKTLNWLGQSSHISNFSFLWSKAITASVLSIEIALKQAHANGSSTVVDKLQTALVKIEKLENLEG